MADRLDIVREAGQHICFTEVGIVVRNLTPDRHVVQFADAVDMFTHICGSTGNICVWDVIAAAVPVEYLLCGVVCGKLHVVPP